MADTKTKENKGWFSTRWTGLKAEFSRIIWPTKATIFSQTVVTLIVTAIAGVVIYGIDQAALAALHAIGVGK